MFKLFFNESSYQLLASVAKYNATCCIVTTCKIYTSLYDLSKGIWNIITWMLWC